MKQSDQQDLQEDRRTFVREMTRRALEKSKSSQFEVGAINASGLGHVLIIGGIVGVGGVTLLLLGFGRLFGFL